MEKDLGKLLIPAGVGRNLFPVEKRISLSGFIPRNLLTSTHVGDILILGRPVFFLPHVGNADFKVDNHPVLGLLASTL